MSQAQVPSVRRTLRCAALALSCTAFAWGPVKAQSEASLVLSALPVASVVASVVGTVVAPSVLVAGGAILTVKAVESTARSTVVVLERASDGLNFSVEIAAGSAAGASLAVGAGVTASVIGTGVVLSAAGEAIAFIPNALGKSLLYNERITH